MEHTILSPPLRIQTGRVPRKIIKPNLTLYKNKIKVKNHHSKNIDLFEGMEMVITIIKITKTHLNLPILKRKFIQFLESMKVMMMKTKNISTNC